MLFGKRITPETRVCNIDQESIIAPNMFIRGT